MLCMTSFIVVATFPTASLLRLSMTETELSIFWFAKNLHCAVRGLEVEQSPCSSYCTFCRRNEIVAEKYAAAKIAHRTELGGGHGEKFENV